MVDVGGARVLPQDDARPVDRAAQQPARLGIGAIVLRLADERALLPERADDERRRGREHEHREHHRAAALQARGRVWWMHAVSVGEVGVAAKLIRELLRRADAPGIVLSTTTPTGLRFTTM